MRTVIRLRRGGMTHNPVYHVVVADKSRPRDGKFLEKLGTYFPKAVKPEDKVSLNSERAQYWISKGAKPSETVRSLLKLKQ